MNILNTQNIWKIQCLDHYTLIVEDAKKTIKFYTNVLGFELFNEIPMNTGTVSQGEYDALNFLLKLPGKNGQICVVTQGLNDKTMFHRYLKKYGSGIHHVAYRVKNIEKIFSELLKKNVILTSSKIINDTVFGLKQFFIDKSYSGVFIEIIEREIEQVTFTHKNMTQLANTMRDFL